MTLTTSLRTKLRVKIEAMLNLTSWFREHDHYLLVTHEKPDLDALGSSMGLYHSLAAVGKDVQVVYGGGYTRSFRFLPGISQALREPKPGFQTVISLDCGDRDRVCGVPLDATIDLNLDHHVTNTMFGVVNLVAERMAATAELLAVSLPEWGLPIPREAAECLLAGILSDTIGFRTNNTTADTLITATKMMALGADLHQIYRKALLTSSVESLKLWGIGLNRMVREGRLVYAVLTVQDWKDSAYPGKDDAELANLMGFIEDVDMAVLIRDIGEDTIKVSWRCAEGFDVSALARQFDGGGHKNASGAKVPGTLDDVQSKVLDATRQYLKGVTQST